MLIRDVKVTISFGDVTAETTIRAGARRELRRELHDTIDRLGDQLGLAMTDSADDRLEFTTDDRKLIQALAQKTSGATTGIDINPIGTSANTTKES